jgi:hypothetical protein
LWARRAWPAPPAAWSGCRPLTACGARRCGQGDRARLPAWPARRRGARSARVTGWRCQSDPRCGAAPRRTIGRFQQPKTSPRPARAHPASRGPAAAAGFHSMDPLVSRRRPMPSARSVRPHAHAADRARRPDEASRWAGTTSRSCAVGWSLRSVGPSARRPSPLARSASWGEYVVLGNRSQRRTLRVTMTPAAAATHADPAGACAVSLLSLTHQPITGARGMPP